MKNNKYDYYAIIQQNYGQGWEDVSYYETDSSYTNRQGSGKFKTLANGYQKEIALITHDIKEYRLLGYATRLINRKELKTN